MLEILLTHITNRSDNLAFMPNWFLSIFQLDFETVPTEGYIFFYCIIILISGDCNFCS
jgi:hypothetical protein